MGSWVPYTGKEQPTADPRVSVRGVSTNGNFHGFLGTLSGQRSSRWPIPAFSESGRTFGYQPTEKIQNVRFFMQSQNWSYLSFYWMELVETFTVCALDVYLLVAKTLRGDVKDFWRYSTFSDWAKIRKFVNFGGFRVSENAQNVHISLYFGLTESTIRCSSCRFSVLFTCCLKFRQKSRHQMR